SSPRAAAERLAEVRRIEAETAMKARADAAKEMVHDATINLTSEQIADQFKALKPEWVQTQRDIDLWKAILRQQGSLADVAAIEKFEQNFEFQQGHEDREALAAAKQQEAQPEPTPQPQPQQPPPPNVEQLRHTEATASALLNNAAAMFQQIYFNLAQVTDPKIHEQAKQDLQAILFGKTYLDGLTAQRQIAEAQAADTQAKQYNAWGKEQDRLFEQSLNDADRAILDEVQTRAPQYFREQGLSDDEMQRAWHQTGQLRDWRAQKTAFHAVKSRMSRDSIEAKKQRPAVPPIQRPGVRGEVPTVDESRIAQLSRALDNPNTSQKDQLRIAAQLLAAQRGRGRTRALST